VAVEGGKEALKSLGEQSNQFHLLLVDVMMPEMDGIELLRIFKKAYSQDIPIIMVSSSEDPDTIAKCFQSGAEDFLQKPVKLEMLKRRVEMCLDDRNRRRKETIYQEILKKERENRSKLTERLNRQEKELEQIKSQITDTIETPMQVVMKTIGDLMDGSYSADQYKGALVAILKSLGSRDLYRPVFSSVLNSETVDSSTMKWLEAEFLQKEETAEPVVTHHKKDALPQEEDANLVVKKTIPDLNNFQFDIFAYPVDEMMVNVAYMFQELGLTTEYNIDNTKLLNFLKSIKTQYHKNHYHSFIHALDVTQFVFSGLCLEKANILSPIERLAMMVSGLCHDVDHPGLNNNYLINAKTSLALLYNDISVLENHHCATTFKTLREPENNFVENLSQEEFKEFRRCVISTILATDMAHHFEILTKFQTRTQSGSLSKDSKDDKQQLMNIIMKIADVSNAVRPYPVAAKWADMLIEEFLEQGDKEREMGIQISPLMDRNTLVRARMQVNFIDYIAGPLYKTAAQYAPGLTITTDTLNVNREIWSSQLERDEEELKRRQQRQKQEEMLTKSASIGTDNVVKTEEKTNTQTVQQQQQPQQQQQQPPTENKEAFYVDTQAANEEYTKVRCKVLLAEDDSKITAKMQSYLHDKVGYEVSVYSTIDEAFEGYTEEGAFYDIALINLDMQGQQGYTLASKIHKYDQDKGKGKKYPKIIPIIGLIAAASNLQQAEQKSKSSGVVQVLQKPISLTVLLKALENALEQYLYHAAPVDHDAALELTGGEEEFLTELLDELVMSAATQQETMQALIDKKDSLTEEEWADLQLHSHSLKGASAQLAAKPISHCAFVIEKASKNHDTAPLEAAIKLLTKRLHDLESYISSK
jgi:CheY-like chemotaxis protein/HPt (histidine-containing phosphotransfer) domain-containing protein